MISRRAFGLTAVNFLIATSTRSSSACENERAEKVAAAIGMKPLGCAEVGGASDGNFAAAAGAQVLDGLGAVGGGAHAPTEWVSVSSMQERRDFLHAFIKDLLAKDVS